MVTSYAQSKSFKISGNLVSEETQEPLESATVYLEQIKDSTLVTYTISNPKGEFKLEGGTSHSQLKLLISYIGYKTYIKNLEIDKSTIELGKISMEESKNQLDEIVITSTAPVTIKKDTLEFNVKSFKTKKDANVEDLLKVLPGVEVDDEGNIRVNGKPVSRILVNGKPFFGNDPTITTRNLTKEIIEKVQVVNTKTKTQAFMDEEGDDENKTINLTIKKEKNKGVFGRLSGGLGTNDRYEFAGMFNRFDNDQRLSVLAGGNNINSPGFSFGEIRKMFGGGGVSYSTQGGNQSFTIGGRTFGGGQGIVTSRNAGVNFTDDFGKKVEFSSDYFHSSSSSENRSISSRENILPDRRFFTDSESYSLNDNQNHSMNAQVDIKVDSTIFINIQPKFQFSKNESLYDRQATSINQNNEITNESTSNSFVETLGKNFQNNLSLTKKLSPEAGYLRFSFNNDINQRDRKDFLASEAYVYGNNPSEVIRDQYLEGENKTTVFTAGINYNIPLIQKKLFLDFGYRYRKRDEDDRRSTFDKNDNNNYTEFNSDLSTDFEYVNEVKEPEVSINFRNKTWSARFKGSYLFRTLGGKDNLRPQFNLTRDFEAVEASSYLNYNFSSKSSVNLSYRLNNEPPRLRQLQAFQNVANPLNIIVGNPNLQPTNKHSMYGGYRNYDFQKKTGFYSYIGANFDNYEVVSKTIVNDDLTRETTYANVNGNYRAYINLNYSKTFKVDSLKTIKASIFAYGNKSRRINFNNGIQYASNTSSISPGLRLSFNWRNILEFSPRYNVSFTKNTFDLDNLDTREFSQHNISLNTATFFPKNLEWRNDFNYRYNSNIGPGFQKSTWFWNATLSYSLLKDKMSITLKAYDILNQNTNARRFATQDFIMDSESTVLQRYFMFGFSWKFNSLGKKGEVRDDRIFMH